MTNILIIVAGVSGALLVLFLVTRTMAAPSARSRTTSRGRRGVIGTTYASSASPWPACEHVPAGAGNEEQEANSLVNVFRIAASYRTQCAPSRASARYADNALDGSGPRC